MSDAFWKLAFERSVEFLGNGRPLRNGVYAANVSPLHVWDMPAS